LALTPSSAKRSQIVRSVEMSSVLVSRFRLGGVLKDAVRIGLAMIAAKNRSQVV